MIGLKRGTVRLFPHSSEWETEAKKTIDSLWNILGDIAVDIQHVGSTAISSIMAKPIIDIAVGTKNLDDVLSLENKLRDNGFFYRPSEIDEQLLFACGSLYEGTGDLQTHFVHVVKWNGMEWKNYLNFRDYLNKKQDVAKEYESLKVSLANKIPKDSGRETYLQGKSEFSEFLY